MVEEEKKLPAELTRSQLVALTGIKDPTGPEGGFIEDDQDEIQIPRLKIVQNLSAEVGNGQARPGDIWSDAHGQVLAPPVTVVPLQSRKDWQKWSGPPPDGVVVWRTSDPRDPRVEEDPESFKYKILSWMVLVSHADNKEISPQVCVMSLKRSSMPIARQWYSMQKRQGMPMWVQKYHIRSTPSKRYNNVWTPLIHPSGIITRKEEIKFTQSLANSYLASFLMMRVEAPPEEGEE